MATGFNNGALTVGDASTSRTNLGLGSAATQNTSAFLQPSNNLSDVSSVSTSRTNLGLGSAATQASTNFAQTLFTQATAVTVANTTTQTSLIGSGAGSVTLAANFFVVNRGVIVKMSGILSTTGTPTLTLQVKYGSSTPGNSGAVTMANTLTNVRWTIEFLIGCNSTGGTGKVWLQGGMIYTSGANGSATNGIDAGNTAMQTIDTTTSNTLDVQVKWGTGNASNTITCSNVVYEYFN